MSIVFDRAVTYYDQTRALPPERHREMIDALVSAAGITPDSRVLEIGIGTGRIALSVAEHVRRLYGIDLSLEMMGVLKTKLRDRTDKTGAAIEVAQANAVQLPFASETFDAVYAVHVYHLVQNWQDALQDARRVVKPGGSLIVSFHKRQGETPNRKLRGELARMLEAYGISNKRPGTQSEDEILAEMEKWNDPLRIVEASHWEQDEVPAEILDDLDRQIFSETWMIPRDVMDKIMPHLRAWAADTFGDLSRPIATEAEARWLVARKRD